MTYVQREAILLAFIAGKTIEFAPTHVEDWCDLPRTATMFDFDRYVYRIKQTPAAAQLAGMPLEERYTVLCAYMKGEKIEWRPFSIGVLPWKPLAPESGLDFSNCEYRIKSAALRPHWPVVRMSSNPDGTTVYSLSNILLATPEDLIGKDGALRLATEHPPVMLP